MTGLLTCPSVQFDTAKHMAQASTIPASFLVLLLCPRSLKKQSLPTEFHQAFSLSSGWTMSWKTPKF